MNEKLHILWVNNIANLTGGCEKYIYDTSILLQQQGYTNTFLYSVDGWTSPEFLKAFDYAFPMVDIKRQIAEIKPDVVYIHRLNSKNLAEFLRTKVPVVRFFHDHKLFCLREHKYKTLSLKTCTQPIGLGCYSCLGFINRSDNYWKIKINTLRTLKKEQNLNKNIDGSIVASDYMKKHLESHGFDGEKINVIPLYSREPQIAEKEVLRKNDTLLFVGQLVRGKGLDVLLKAMSLLKTKPQLWVVGEGRQQEMFAEMTLRLSLQNQVHFLGKKSNLSNYYQECTFLVFPSRSPETFGLVGPEAMSYSTPVIASDVGGMRQWLEDGETGILTEANNPESIALAIEKLLSHPELRLQMGKKAQTSYRNKFMPQQHITKLIEFLKKFQGIGNS